MIGFLFLIIMIYILKAQNSNIDIISSYYHLHVNSKKNSETLEKMKILNGQLHFIIDVKKTNRSSSLLGLLIKTINS